MFDRWLNETPRDEPFHGLLLTSRPKSDQFCEEILEAPEL